VIGSNDVTGVCLGTDRSKRDAEKAEDTRNHVDGLFACEDTKGTKSGVWGGDLTGGECSEEIDVEEIPLGGVGDLRP